MSLIAQFELIPVVTLVTNAVLALLTAAYVVYTQKLVKFQTEPCVIVYVERSDSDRGMINIVVANVGGSIARDIEFELDGDVPRQEMHGIVNPTFKRMESGPLIDGIPGLAAGAKRLIYWGDAWGLFKEFRGKRVWVKCTYNVSMRTDVISEPMSTENVLEVDSLALEEQPYSWDRSEGHLRDIARHIEKVSAAVEHCHRELSRRPMR